ncbi:NADPH:quinone reductase-like Zn-dependent oxidoreductase [Altererythrobacter atlanticus]|uniref:Alcohol dehydrogenase n=1 Tax=Croceibacterium atlanticum TaxID=1267766 RepID=A0A0F7KUW1_9SPHN|nr:NAD(P)-dependent alcohol dehydrogenase [Croceibacterium atlanticum]AKH42961.1 Alcohol dehydrogenase [Croceibacterium atlanticum]MBB5734082.1 NADPH:quinone reductase-like Zn-dependent oxidoreductase [Croceibacterium atlanticum]
MRAWMLPAGSDGFDKLYQEDLPTPEPGPGEVLIRLRAWSINYRDFAVAAGQYFGGALKAPAIPLSDGAGEVAAIGPGVTAVKEGDRVQGSFFTDWVEGPPRMGPALGDGMSPGMLAEYVVLPERAVVPMAQTLDFAQAACLPCAGVTAWNALYEGPRALVPGMKVLVLGTGGVSMLALQLARAGGCEVIATSSSDEKLERVRALGASHTLNYKTTADWGAHVAGQFGGVDKVVEVGGAGTAEQSMASLRTLGEVAFIGVLSPEGGPNPRSLMMTGGSLRGIFVGSVAMAKKLNAAIDTNRIEPLIGARFGFDQAKDAYAHAWGPESFAKTVIELD